MMKRKFILLFLPMVLSFSAHAAPPILSYGGQVSVDGQPFTGTGLFKFAFVDGQGQFSYWSQDGTSSAGSEPTGQVSVPVNAGLYSVMLGDTGITGMSTIDESVFQNHNDVHLRIWFSDGQGFEQLTPDRRFASVPYSLGANGTSTANLVSTGSGSGAGDNNSSITNIHNYNFGGPLGMGHARLVADGPDNPSTTLVLLSGDSAEIASYVADKPGRLEYAFDAYTISLPRGEDSLLSEQSTLIGPGSVRLTAPTGVVNIAILKVNRASGRDPNKVQGSPAPGSTAPAPAPAIVSVPQTRSVARGGTTTLFVSASGDNLSYQWKKNGADIAGATSAGLPLQNATGADEGNYSVVISNSEGFVHSAPIVVEVKMPAVPTGVYRINNSNGATGHEVALTGFSIDQHEVTKAFWDEVYAWAVNNGYSFTNAGIAEGPEHPVHSVNWYDCVKWANALSERDGHTPCYYTDNNCTQVYRTGEVDLTNYNVRWNVDGYRLPTESEWEVAARGGLEGSKYAWGESASTSKANFDQSLHGATLPVGSYPSMGYGLYEIGGNLREWVWDVQSSSDTNDYIYENHELFTHSSSGQLDLVENETTASYGWVGSEMWTNTSGYPIEYISPSTDFSSIETLSLPFPFLTNQIRFFILARGYYYAKFFFLDGTEETTQQVNLESQGSDTITTCTVNNPSPGKLIKQISIYAKRYPGDWTYSRTRVFGFQIGKSYKSGSSSSTLLINLPEMNDYNSTSYRVSINNGEETPITFSLLDEAGNALVENGKFNEFQFLTNPTKISKLKFLIPASSGNPETGGFSISSVSWTLSNPKKSILNLSERVLRDNHYAEGLQHLSKRNFSSPANRYSMVGFRLVQRP